MTRALSLGTCIGLLTFVARGAGVSNVSFGQPRPLRYVRPQNDYRFVHVGDENRNVFAEVVPGCRVRLWACPVGECVLGRNTIRPRMQFLGRDGQTATSVRIVISLKEQGRPLRPCVDETVTVTNVKDGSEFRFTYTIERMGREQSVLAAFYESDPDHPDIHIEVPCPVPYLGRVVLTRPTFWENDPSARAWVCLNLDRDHLNRFKVRARVTSEQGREFWSDTVDELRGRLLWFDADVSSLPNDKYTLECEVVDENGVVRDTQSNDFVKKPLPVVERRTLPITIEEAPGITRDSFPACADVPFPDGELASSHGLRLRDAAGQQVDAQFTPTGFWNERRTFVKWLRIALNAATGATGENKYRLEYGSRVKRNPVKGIVLREGLTIAVKTGKLEFEVGKAAPAGRVRAAGARIDLVGHIELARPVRSKFGPFSEVDGHLLRNLSQGGWRFKTEMGDQDRTSDWARPDFDDRKWKPIRTTTFWDEQGHMHKGYAWYRLTFPLSAEQVRKDAFLHFGAVDEQASVYLNGEYLGGTEDKGTT